MDIKNIDNFLLGTVENLQVPSIAAIIVDQEKILYEGYYGFKNINTQERINHNTLFRIASMTKPITSLCILQLIERGSINLDTNIEDISEKYKKIQIINSFEANNPIYTNPTNKIKIKHLLNHTAGYGYEIWDKEINELVTLKLLNSLFDDDSDFLNAPILFNPGSEWKYGINIDVLGDLVEKITNQKLGTFMNENIFKKINMTKTSFDLTKEDFENIAIKHSINKKNGYIIEDDELEFHNSKKSNQFHAGGGGLFSTPRDYSKFMQIFLNQGKLNNHTLLSKENFKNMTTNQIGSLNTNKLNSVMPDISNIADFNPEIQKKFSYGFMINTEKTNEGRPKNSLFWTGLLNTFFWIDLENKIAASIFMQTNPYFSKECVEVFKNFEKKIYS